MFWMKISTHPCSHSLIADSFASTPIRLIWWWCLSNEEEDDNKHFSNLHFTTSICFLFTKNAQEAALPMFLICYWNCDCLLPLKKYFCLFKIVLCNHLLMLGIYQLNPASRRIQASVWKRAKTKVEISSQRLKGNAWNDDCDHPLEPFNGHLQKLFEVEKVKAEPNKAA